MIRDAYWAIEFAEEPPGRYLFIGWDDTVNEQTLPVSLGFRMLLFKTRKAARIWTKARNVSMEYWTHNPRYLKVTRVRVTVAPPPRIRGKLA